MTVNTQRLSANFSANDNGWSLKNSFTAGSGELYYIEELYLASPDGGSGTVNAAMSVLPPQIDPSDVTSVGTEFLDGFRLTTKSNDRGVDNGGYWKYTVDGYLHENETMVLFVEDYASNTNIKMFVKFRRVV